MSVDNNFCVYVHLAADSGLPFYIGKGRTRRAYNFTDRNIWWKRHKELHGCIVEFLHTNLTEDSAFKLEIEEIKWFKDNGFTLVNLTDGGEGPTNSAQTNENKKRILKFHEDNGRFPSQYKKEEAQLYGLLHSYCSKSQAGYCDDFHRKCIELGYGHKADEKKQIIIKFCHDHNRLPQKYVKEETQLWIEMNRYCSRTAKCYCPEFRSIVESFGYGLPKPRDPKVETKWLEIKNKIRDFLKINGRFPTRCRKEEVILWRWLKDFCSLSSNYFCYEFRKEMEEMGYGKGEKRGERIR